MGLPTVKSTYAVAFMLSSMLPHLMPPPSRGQDDVPWLEHGMQARPKMRHGQQRTAHASLQNFVPQRVHKQQNCLWKQKRTAAVPVHGRAVLEEAFSGGQIQWAAANKGRRAPPGRGVQVCKPACPSTMQIRLCPCSCVTTYCTRAPELCPRFMGLAALLIAK
eukprot:1160054-Pelagomonas_calceolata.AAC.2